MCPSRQLSFPHTIAALVVFKGEYSSADTQLTVPQIKELRPNQVRKLHPDELLFSLSFKQDELPRWHAARGIKAQYDMACQTICRYSSARRECPALRCDMTSSFCASGPLPLAPSRRWAST